jgi:molybdate transport system ATP-binding protein
LLLLDEPFAGLDVEAASAMRALIKDLLGDVTTVLSTHDALDAYALASHVAILGKGQVVQSGPTHDVLSRPLTPFAARVASRVLITGTLSTPTTLEVDGGGTLRVSQRGRGSATLPRGARAAIAVGPRDIALGTGLDSDGIRDTVVALEPQGDTVRVHGSRFAVDVEPAAAAALRPGDPITLRLPERAMPYALGD